MAAGIREALALDAGAHMRARERILEAFPPRIRREGILAAVARGARRQALTPGQKRAAWAAWARTSDPGVTRRGSPPRASASMVAATEAASASTS